MERLEVDAARLWGRNGCGGRSPSPPALAWSLLLASWSLLGAQRREIAPGIFALLPVNRALCPWDNRPRSEQYFRPIHRAIEPLFVTLCIIGGSDCDRAALLLVSIAGFYSPCQQTLSLCWIADLSAWAV